MVYGYTVRSLDCPDDLAEFAASAALFWRFLSDWVRIVADHDLSSRIVVSHIRKATMGDRAHRNTQPFIRELSGSVHLFAHNGWQQRILADKDYQSKSFAPSEKRMRNWPFAACLIECVPSGPRLGKFPHWSYAWRCSLRARRN